MSAADPLALGDVAADRLLTPAEVRSALSAILSLNSQEVLVVTELETLPRHALPTHKIVCHMSLIGGGDFPTCLSFFGGAFEQMPRMHAADELCRALRCRLLVDDGSMNPFTFLLVDGTGTPRPVAVDPERWDANEYVLTSGREI